jgi:hypothetical protein
MSNVAVSNPAFTPNLTRKVREENTKAQILKNIKNHARNTYLAGISEKNLNRYFEFRPNISKLYGRPELMTHAQWLSIIPFLSGKSENTSVDEVFRAQGILPPLVPTPPPGRKRTVPKGPAGASAFQQVVPFPGEEDSSVDPRGRSSGVTAASGSAPNPSSLSMGSVAAPGPVGALSGAVSGAVSGSNSMASGAPSLGSLSSADPGAYSVARRTKPGGRRKSRRVTRKRATRRR